MAHVFEAATDFREAIEWAHRACIFNNDFIPVVYRGKVFAGALDFVTDPKPGIPAADFVMNMEVLGVRFWIMKTPEGDDRLLQPEGYHMLPAHWISRAEALRAAFPVERDAEAIAFMRQRGDIAVGEEPDPDPFVARMQRYRAEVEVYRGNEDDGDEPGTSFGAELSSGAVTVSSLAGAALALRQVLEENCIIDTFDEKLVVSTLAFLEGRVSA